MWEQDWALLGLEPTTDLAAIKKAYAARLKLTRPDDDAEAYQALRAAYERVQQWARWQRENPAAAEDAPPLAPKQPSAIDAPLPQLPPLARPQDEALAEPALIVPQHLFDELGQLWRRAGETALMDGWSQACQALNLQPLNRQAEFSAAFAQWALDHPALPDDFLKALDAHFGWLNDFRTERLLGPALAQALHEALGERLYPAPVPEPVHELAAPVMRLYAAQTAGGGWWRMQLLSLLLQPTLSRALNLLGTDWLRRLGLDLQALKWLEGFIKRGLWLRVGIACALCFGAALFMFGDVIIAGAHMLGWMLGTGAVMLGGLLAATLIGVGPALTHGQKRLALPLDRWRRNRLQPVLGLVWLLFAAWMAAHDVSPTWTSWQLVPPLDAGMAWLYPAAAWGFGIAGLVAAWPLLPLHGWVIAGLSPLVGALFVMALGRWLPLASCLLLALAWMQLAAAVHEERIRATGWALWPLRPMLNALALAQRWTYSVALLPLACAAAYLTLNDGPVRASTVFLIWVFGNLGTAWLQDKADTWAQKQLPAPAER